MTKTTKTQAAEATRLVPTVVTNNNEIGAAAFEGTRKRPILAINDEGDLVVCCRATARTHGWTVEGSLHVRPQQAKPAKKVGQQRRATDKEGVVIMPAQQVKELKASITNAAATLGVDDLLATK